PLTVPSFHIPPSPPPSPPSLHDALPISRLEAPEHCEPGEAAEDRHDSERGRHAAPEAPRAVGDCDPELDQRVGDRHDTDRRGELDRKSTRLNSSHGSISYAVFCLKKKKV